MGLDIQLRDRISSRLGGRPEQTLGRGETLNWDEVEPQNGGRDRGQPGGPGEHRIPLNYAVQGPQSARVTGKDSVLSAGNLRPAVLQPDSAPGHGQGASVALVQGKGAVVRAADRTEGSTAQAYVKLQVSRGRTAAN